MTSDNGEGEGDYSVCAKNRWFLAWNLAANPKCFVFKLKDEEKTDT